MTLTQVLLCLIARLHLSTGYAVPATLRPSWQPASGRRPPGGCAQCVQGRWQRPSAVCSAGMHVAAPLADEDHRLARLLKHDLLDLNRRIMASPYELGAEVPVGATCFSLEKLRSEAGRGPVSQQLCRELRKNHCVIVRPDAAGQAAVHDMWAQARRFFDLPAERKEDAAGWVRVACAACLCSPAVRVDGYLAGDCARYITSTLCVTTSGQAYAKGRGQRRGHRVGHHAG
jgi:hypothetical protein